MEVAIIFLIIIAVVFAGVFLSGRRLGPLALALAAGSILSTIWADSLTIIISGLGFEVPGLPYGVISTVIIVLLPMLVLLFGGPRYLKKVQRVFAALLVSALAAALLVHPLGSYMTLDGASLETYELMLDWWPYLVTVGLVMGLVDLFLLHSVKAPSK